VCEIRVLDAINEAMVAKHPDAPEGSTLGKGDEEVNHDDRPVEVVEARRGARPLVDEPCSIWYHR
jgi:hypothetical protein